jgi:hypothetical protein
MVNTIENIAAGLLVVLIDAIQKDPKFFLLLAILFVFGPWLCRPSSAPLEQIQQELKGLDKRLDNINSRLDGFERSVSDLEGHIEQSISDLQATNEQSINDLRAEQRVNNL